MQNPPSQSAALPVIITLLVIAAVIGAAFFTKASWLPYFSAQKDVNTESLTNPENVGTVPATETPETREVGFMVRAEQILQALKDQNLSQLAPFVHPEKGVRLTLSSFINTENDIILSPEQIKNSGTDQKQYTWGIADGSGEPITMTITDYFKKHVYDKDFAAAPQISSEKILGTGNTTNNQTEIYPDAKIVEYHFPEFDPQYGGMDWESLRLVFEKKDTSWYLIGIIHDQWSI